MSHVYGEDTWGNQHAGVFEENLKSVDVAIHSRSSNLYGVMDNDDYFKYLGGLVLKNMPNPLLSAWCDLLPSYLRESSFT